MKTKVSLALSHCFDESGIIISRSFDQPNDFVKKSQQSLICTHVKRRVFWNVLFLYWESMASNMPIQRVSCMLTKKSINTTSHTFFVFSKVLKKYPPHNCGTILRFLDIHVQELKNNVTLEVEEMLFFLEN